MEFRTDHEKPYTVADLVNLKRLEMLVVNPEYQRGARWTEVQQKRLIDSVLRGYPLPLFYFHHIKREAGGLTSERFEIIDGQQRMNALFNFHEGAFALFDPVKDDAVARFPAFIKQVACPWGGLDIHGLSPELREQFLETPLAVCLISKAGPNDARDLFIRLQAGMPLEAQEKRDAWPGNFTDFVLRLGGKPEIARYPGHKFFSELMRADRAGAARFRFRQFAAQVAMLFVTRKATGRLTDTRAENLDDFYYAHLDFPPDGDDARRLLAILDKLYELFRDEKRSKIVGHEAIHLVLLLDTLWDDYTRSWETKFAASFDLFRAELSLAMLKAKRGEVEQAGDYYLKYGLGVGNRSDRADTIQRRHDFFSQRMLAALSPTLKDPKRLYGQLEREIIYARDGKRCQRPGCGADMPWAEADIHHVEEHAKGGATSLENGALVHRTCHPQGAEAVREFARRWRESRATPSSGTDVASTNADGAVPAS